MRTGACSCPCCCFDKAAQGKDSTHLEISSTAAHIFCLDIKKKLVFENYETIRQERVVCVLYGVMDLTRFFF